MNKKILNIFITTIILLSSIFASVPINAETLKADAINPCVSAIAPTTWKVVVLVLENRTYSQVIGNSNAPFISSLATKCGTSKIWNDANFKVNGTRDVVGDYNSKPNYATFTSGLSPSVTHILDDTYATQTSVQSIYNQMLSVGVTFKDYYGSTTAGGCSIRWNGDYHDPIRYFSTINSTTCNAHDFPISQFVTDYSSGNLPRFSMILPNSSDSCHDNSTVSCDTYTNNLLTSFLNSAEYASGHVALFLIFDEDTIVPNVLISPSIVSGSVYQPVTGNNPVSHFSVLRTWEEMLGLPLLGDVAQAPSLLNFYKGSQAVVTVTPVSTQPTATKTNTPISTITRTVTSTVTKTITPDSTNTSVAIPSNTPTFTQTPNPFIGWTCLSDSVINFCYKLKSTLTPTLTPSLTPTLTLTPSKTPTQTPSNTATLTKTSTPTATPTNTVTKTLTPLPTQSVGNGIWISTNEIMALPTNNAVWTNISSTAYGSWQTPNLQNQDNKNGIQTLSGAIVSVRLNDNTLKAKVKDNIIAAKRTLDESSEFQSTNGVLSSARQIGAYVISADLINLKSYDPIADKEFRDWLTTITKINVGSHSRWKSINYTCENSGNNWGTFSCASRIARSIYLGDTSDVQRVSLIIRAFLGERNVYPSDAPGQNGYFQPTSDFDSSWTCNSTAWTVINPSCVKNGIDISGADVEDSSRGGSCCVLGTTGSSYDFEAEQGLIVSIEMLYRTNNYGNPYLWSSQALKRSLDFLQRQGWNITSPSMYVPWLANYRYGTNYPTANGGNGRIMSWGDFLYQIR